MMVRYIRMSHNSMRFAFVALALATASLSGCGGNKVEEGVITTEEPQELQDANKAMEEYMESGGAEGAQ